MEKGFLGGRFPRLGGFVEDILTRLRALRGLLALRAVDPEPLTARGFQQAVGYENEVHAAELRADLESWNLVRADEKRLPIPVSLTTEGRAVAALAAELDALAPKGLLERPRALRALVVVRQNEPDPMTAGVLRRAVGYDVKAATRLREDLARLGVLDVEEGVAGRVRFVRMRLTPLGRKVADAALRVEARALKAKKKT